MVAKLDHDQLEAMARRLGELVREGYVKPGSAARKGKINATTALARELDRCPTLIRAFVRRMIQCGLDRYWTGEVEAIEPIAKPQTRAEIFDAGFWKRKAQLLEKELAKVEHLASELAGIRGVPFQIPEWAIENSSGQRGQAVIGALVSDVHMGEKIDPEEINGVNAFDPDICRRRMRRYFSAVCEIGLRWSSDTDCLGAFVAFAGDLVSGDIHDELRVTNALTSVEQCVAVAEEICLGLKLILETYGRAHVVFVPGNHGRTTHKPTAKLYARLSYDMLVGSMVAQRFADDKRITFQMSAAKDQVTPIFRRIVLTTHGDKIGTKGGMGFAGPMLPIVRGAKKIDAQQAEIGRKPDLIQFGHYHTTGNPGNVLANGSFPGYSEYGDDLRAVFEPPQQWMYLLHSKWWLRERMPVQLEDPGIPERPRVRMPWGGEPR